MQIIAARRKVMTKEEIQTYINENINPGLEMHGGFLLIKGFDEESKTLRVEMGGGCHGCASSTATLKLVITQLLKEEFPSIGDIIDVTDHAQGVNPYYG